MTHVSLFTGIGGADLAAEWAGFRTVLQVENDDYCRRVLEKHWPGVPRVSDIREVHEDERWTEPTVVSGGFPCQPFSAAGKRRGTEDDRYLWPEMRRAIEELKPAWVIAENVAGLLSMAQLEPLPDVGPGSGSSYREGDVYSREGRGYLDSILGEIEALGYEVIPDVIPAAAVDAPHERYRVFIVAYAGDHRQWSSFQQIAERWREEATDVGSDGEIRDVVEPICGRQQAGRLPIRPGRSRETEAIATRASEDVADTDGRGRPQPTRSGREEGLRIRDGGETVADTEGEQVGRAGQSRESAGRHAEGEPKSRMGGMVDGFPRWVDEPRTPRVATGVKNRVDRLRALGNAIVPQQIYPIFAAIREAENEPH